MITSHDHIAAVVALLSHIHHYPLQVPKPTAEPWAAMADTFVPAGRPQPRTSVYLLDPSSTEEVTSGEICFGGVISTGYWNRPDLTSQRRVKFEVLTALLFGYGTDDWL